MFERGDIFEGVCIRLREWRTVVNTLKEYCVIRRGRWFNVVGFPFHLLGEENLPKLGECVGVPIQEDKNTLDLVKLVSSRVKINCREVCWITEPNNVSDGVKGIR